ncbi:hypothetical protein BGX38DRAFT_543822 [Terfezia claveryi]|nr:hypothetical protein BGX38DRAFT_543822 [Terfezia claveryi]
MGVKIFRSWQHLLPPTNLTDSLIAKGPIKLYRAKPHNTAFIQSGKTEHPVMAKSACWCVEEVVGKGIWGRGRGKGVFVLRIRLGMYWRVEINEAGMNGAVEEFKNALRGALSFEKEECPFVRMDVVFVGQDEKEKEKELMKKEKEWITVKQSMETPKTKRLSTSPPPYLRLKNHRTKPLMSASGGPPPTPLPSPALESFGDHLLLPIQDPIRSDAVLVLRPRSPCRPGPLTFGRSRGLPPPTPLLSPYFLPGMVSFDDVLHMPMCKESHLNPGELLDIKHTSDQYEELSELLNRNHTVGQGAQSSEQTSCRPIPIGASPAVNSSVESLGFSTFTYPGSATSYGAEAPDSKPEKVPREPSYRQPWVVPPPKTTTGATLTNSETTFITTYEDDSNLLSQLVPQSGKMLSAAADMVVVKPSVYLAEFMQRIAKSVVAVGR